VSTVPWWTKAQDEGGNIDLSSRPEVPNPRGGTSTVFSTSFGIDGQEVLVPRVRKGLNRPMSEDEAMAHYLSTGEHLGKFSGPDAVAAANAAGAQIHREQEAMGREAQRRAMKRKE